METSRSRSKPIYPKVDVVVEDDKSEGEYDIEIDTRQHAAIAETSQSTPVAVSVYQPIDPSMLAHQRTLQSSLQQQTKTTDDSRTAFGERYASSFGQRGVAPMPEPTAPALEEDEWSDYQAWMNAPTFADRSKFENHTRWSAILNQGQSQFELRDKLALLDDVSERFSTAIKNKPNQNFFNGNGNPPSYTEMEDYIPTVYTAQMRQNNAGPIDQVQEMMAYADAHFKTSFAYGRMIGHEVKSNAFIVLSDHNGESSGRDLQIWGPGTKKSLTIASSEIGKSLGIVNGAAQSYNTNTDYEYVSDRFTIIRINNNELGFILDRVTNAIKKMQAGRYVIQEKLFCYIGKAIVKRHTAEIIIKAHNQQDPATVELAKQLQIVHVTPGVVAFVRDNHQTYMLNTRMKPYILDKRRSESFINFQDTNQQIIRAADNNYALINQLQPGQFIIFQHKGRLIVWHHDTTQPEHNTLHLPANKYLFDNKIHNISENHFTINGTHIINMKPGQTLVVRDQTQRVRFIEEFIEKTIVLRTDWQFLGLISQNQQEYRCGSKEEGNEIVRLMLRSSEWAAVVDRKGHLSFYPPRLENKPYYFLQPEHTVIQVLNKNKIGETKLQVPGIGSVSIVNIASGSIGACRLRNMHFFLNPSDVPYVFITPDVFIETIDAKKAHIQIGDLHRIVLKPDERAVVSKDGKLYRLPENNVEGNLDLSDENGIYVFRSFQLEMYGPEKKSKKQYNLGTIQYFNVGVGEVAYGTQQGKLRIWEAGEHAVDNRKNEWFKDFFSTNVDPVQINRLPVTFQHGITGTVGVYVSYRIEHSEKAIEKFKDHSTLHEFIEKTSQSEMIKLCASRPPLGYTDLYFSSEESKADSGDTEDVNAAVQKIQNSFMDHAKELLDEYGVRISNMKIDSWELAPDFVKQVQDNAKRLGDAHAEVEQTRMGLQKSELLNKQAIQRSEAEITLKEKENARLQLDLIADKLRLDNQSAIEADANILVAKTQATIDVNAAQARAQIAEHQATGEIAAQRVKSEIALSIAQNNLATKEAEVKALSLQINAERERGLAEADIISAKELARYQGLSTEQRMELQITEINAKNQATLIHMCLEKGIQLPGLLSLDHKAMALQRTPFLLNTNPLTSGSVSSNFGMGLFPPASPTQEQPVATGQEIVAIKP